jgi:hypothetical protein
VAVTPSREARGASLDAPAGLTPSYGITAKVAWGSLVMTNDGSHQRPVVELARLKDLFCQAIEKPPRARDRWLARRRENLGDDLRTALHELLDAHAAAGGFLSDPSIDLSR